MSYPKLGSDILVLKEKLTCEVLSFPCKYLGIPYL